MPRRQTCAVRMPFTMYYKVCCALCCMTCAGTPGRLFAGPALSMGAIIGLTVGCVAGAGVVVMLVAMILNRPDRHRRNFWGKLAPAGLGPETTLVRCNAITNLRALKYSEHYSEHASPSDMPLTASFTSILTCYRWLHADMEPTLMPAAGNGRSR